MALPPRIKRNSGKADEGRRSPAHRKWVRGHQCCVPRCKGMPIECCHVRDGTDGGMGIKPSDRWTISLCKAHHHEQHGMSEHLFEQKYGIDMKALAEEFFRNSKHRHKLTAGVSEETEE